MWSHLLNPSVHLGDAARRVSVVDGAFRHFLEYPATEQEKWKAFRKTYLQYLQWETEKARYNLPYLVAPSLLSFYLYGTGKHCPASPRSPSLPAHPVEGTAD